MVRPSIHNTPLTDEQKQLVEANLDVAQIVASKAIRHAQRRVDIAEYQSSASVGLMEAARTFDHSRGFTFHTYAARRAAGHILDDIRGDSWFTFKEGRGTAPKIDRSKRPAPVVAANDSPMMEGYKVFATNERDTENRDAIDAMLRLLPARYALMLKLYYLAGLTMKEVGAAIGISESRVSQEMSHALTAARESRAARELQEVL